MAAKHAEIKIETPCTTLVLPLVVHPGDTVVLKADHAMTREQYEEIKAQWRETVSEDVGVVILGHLTPVAVIREEDESE